jgi:hypothetical protein
MVAAPEVSVATLRQTRVTTRRPLLGIPATTTGGAVTAEEEKSQISPTALIAFTATIVGAVAASGYLTGPARRERTNASSTAIAVSTGGTAAMSAAIPAARAA